jgi:hypothetical protein
MWLQTKPFSASQGTTPSDVPRRHQVVLNITEMPQTVIWSDTWCCLGTTQRCPKSKLSFVQGQASLVSSLNLGTLQLNRQGELGSWTLVHHLGVTPHATTCPFMMVLVWGLPHTSWKACHSTTPHGGEYFFYVPIILPFHDKSPFIMHLLQVVLGVATSWCWFYLCCVLLVWTWKES